MNKMQKRVVTESARVIEKSMKITRKSRKKNMQIMEEITWDLEEIFYFTFIFLKPLYLLLRHN